MLGLNVAISLLLLVGSSVPGVAGKYGDMVAPVAPMRAEPFPLEDIRLSNGPFRHAMELDRAYLLSLDPERLLYSFRVNAGLPTTAKPYGGWMTPGRASCAEFVGHYLSACALMYASTGDERVRERANQVVAGFGECQKKLGTGYLHTKPDRFTHYGEAPLGLWYQIHKIMAGLMEMYVHCHNDQALDIARKLGDWAKNASDAFSDEQMQNMLEVEHGGINEAFANLYALTGDRKYLQLALRFNHQEVIGPASRRVDNLTGKHANTQIPKFIGAAREYELGGPDELKTAAEFFWRTVAEERSYVIGGDSIGEHFSPKETLSQAIGPDTCETCNTYNMLKLTRHLFCWEPRAEYADFYERALYNHILASQNPSNGMMVYFLPLSSAPKEYCTPEDSFWCCTGTGIENHAKYGDSIYFHRGTNALFVNLFIASQLNWATAGIVLRQETPFPDEGRTRLTLSCAKPVQLELHLRHPYWATSGFEIKINGQRQALESQPGSYAVVSREWHSGDTVEVHMPFSLRTEGFRDNPRRVAVMYGPLVLCAETGAVALNESSLPALVGEEGHWYAGLKPLVGHWDDFIGPGVLHVSTRNDRTLVLRPIHLTHGNSPYIVYWNALTTAEWQATQSEDRAISARAIDQVLPGNEADERAHQVRGENTYTGSPGWRHAVDGGWFSWRMRSRPNQSQELRVKYWGGDAGGREFDVLVDGQFVATQKLENNRPGEFFEAVYPIPADVTHGKAIVTVKFQAHRGKVAGGVFGCLLVASDSGGKQR
jgi:uncharacterized protein